MRVFVTGATGLLGNNCVRSLLNAGYEVRCLVRSDAKAARLLGDTGAECVVGDMGQVSDFADALEDCDAVFHTAAYFREYYQPGDHEAELRRINVEGLLALMAAADERNIRRFVHVSSSGMIGMKPDGSPGDEDTPPAPIALQNLYFKSKIEGDREIRAWTPQRGMAVLEVYPGWMWGPGDAAPTPAGQLVLDFLKKKVPGIVGGGTCVVDARDVAHAMIGLLDTGDHGERFIVGGRFVTLAGILRELESVTGIPGPRVRIPYPVLMAYATGAEMWAKLTGNAALITRNSTRVMKAGLKVSSAKAERQLGVRFRPFSETVSDTVAWHRANPHPGHAPAG